jgi:tight adherence protein B
MRRFGTILVAVLLAALAIVSAAFAAPAGGGVKVVQAGGAHFPYRSFVLTLPSHETLPPNSVHVTENGKPVAGLTVTSSSANVQRRFGTVLVIDASRSMTHKPIASAMAAARAFASHRNGQTPLGVITFNGKSVVALPLTTDSTAIDSALANPPTLARQTHVYDAVSGAIAMLRREGATAGSVVVLSDGADTGSRASATADVYWAKQSGVRIFSVGLRSGAFDPRGLRTLASGSAGEYVEASSPSELAPIYGQLSARIASEYLVTYRSIARPHKHVLVQTTVDGHGQPVTTQYVTPALQHYPGQSLDTTSFWGSPGTMVLIALICALLLGSVVILVIRPDPNSVQARMAQFVSPAQGEYGHAKGSTVTSKALGRAEESLERREWWATFKEELEIARVKVPAFQLLTGTIIATAATALFLLTVTGSVIFAVLALGVPIGVRTWVSIRLTRQRRAFGQQLADTLQVVASAMRAGYSFIAALGMGVEDAPDPIGSELRRVVVDERLGVSLEDSMRTVGRRMDSPEFDQVVLVTILQRETGGNTAELLEHVAGAIRERYELRRTVQTLTAQGRISRWILTGLPVVLLVVLLLINRDYMRPLFETSTGRVLLVFSAAMIASGSWVIKRIIDIKV